MAKCTITALAGICVSVTIDRLGFGINTLGLESATAALQVAMLRTHTVGVAVL